ncbi:MAG: hypothetical protein ACTHKZ_03810 [Lysobacteraceae bacterium]
MRFAIRRPIAWRWVLAGGLVLATLDAAFATGYWRLAAGVPWTRVFQSVAAGVLGVEASVAGGAATAWLGLALHYAIAMCFVAACTLAATRRAALLRHAPACGIAYGLLLYLVMNWVVIPLSAIGHLPSFGDRPWVAGSVAMHAVVGLVCAYAARRALAALSGRLPVPSAR